MAEWIDVGVDCGTSVTKAVAVDDAGRVRAAAQRPMRWSAPSPGWGEAEAAALEDAVDAILAEVAAATPGLRIRSVGVCSIAETGALVDADGRVRTRLMAWHDPRGTEQAHALDPALAAAFPSRTGLSVSPVPTLFKLLWLRDEGVDLAGLTWLGVGDLVVRHLGAPAFAERSVLGRTGLHDVHGDGPWAPALALLGAGPDLLPPDVAAGAALGRVRADHPVEAARGAVLTVAGHDHLVAAAAVGAGAVGSVCDSIGTAEALTVALSEPPTPQALADLVAHGASVHAHVVDGATCVLTGLRTGLVLEHVLTRLGATTRDQRRALDAAASRTREQADVMLSGLALDDEQAVVATWPDGAPPGAVWAGTLARLREAVEARVAAVRRAGGAVDELFVTGGWAHLEGVLASRHGLLDRMTVVRLDEPGAVGSALFGRWAAGQGEATDPTRQPSPSADWFTAPRA